MQITLSINFKTNPFLLHPDQVLLVQHLIKLVVAGSAGVSAAMPNPMNMVIANDEMLSTAFLNIKTLLSIHCFISHCQYSPITFICI